MKQLLRQLPSVDRLLCQLGEPASDAERQRWLRACRQTLENARNSLLEGGPLPSPTELAERARQLAIPAASGWRRVLNATGVILHTNLGRAPLAPEAASEAARAGGGYGNLEFDLASGKRGRRDALLGSHLQQLTGAAGVLAVNNCAAALALVVDTLARDREVVVSRGELVEVGGGFRIPDVLTQAGARLREVGATNRTYLRDFEAALSDESAMVLSTHTSNFRQSGFVCRPEAAELTALARERGVFSVLDLGGGLLRPEPGLDEPSVQECVAQGWDLVVFSGDKLLGGPQAGLVTGEPSLLARLARNPWMRALRLDKLRLAALEATLRQHLVGEVPVLSLLRRPAEQLLAWCQASAARLESRLGERAAVSVRPSEGSVGGGTQPAVPLAGWAVCLQPTSGGVERWAEALRACDPAVVTRRKSDALWCDFRCLDETEIELLEIALEATAP